MSKTRYHLHYTKAGLLIELVEKWPVDWVTGGLGKPFGSLREAVEAVLEIPSPNVPIGCPSPAADGTCPGHTESAS